MGTKTVRFDFFAIAATVSGPLGEVSSSTAVNLHLFAAANALDEGGKLAVPAGSIKIAD
jgi:hypothetical protein